MSAEEPAAGASPGRFFVPSLILVTFAVFLSTPILTLLSVDIARTFFGNVDPTSLGAVSQIGTVNSAAEVVFALLMGVLAVRFKHRSLLLGGMALVVVSAIGSFFAPTLLVLQIFFALEGAGTVIVNIFALSLVGELLPSKTKAKTVGYLVGVTSLATLVGAPVIGFITNVGGWQSNFLWLVLPSSVVGLGLAYFGLPSTPRKIAVETEHGSYFAGFKKVLSNRSAAACLIGMMLVSSVAVPVFAIAFYRQQYLSNLPVPEQINFVVVILMVAMATGAAASFVVGRLVNRVGAKNLTVAGALVSSVLTTVFFFMPNFWVAIALDMIHVGFYFAAYTAFSCLALDQVPSYRGTMMSMKNMFYTIGIAMGTAVGGVMLSLFSSYQAVGLAIGAMGVTSAAVFFFLTRDPSNK
jgi:predicted MFS family arabinose efflux permease